MGAKKKTKMTWKVLVAYVVVTIVAAYGASAGILGRRWDRSDNINEGPFEGLSIFLQTIILLVSIATMFGVAALLLRLTRQPIDKLNAGLLIAMFVGIVASVLTYISLANLALN